MVHKIYNEKIKYNNLVKVAKLNVDNKLVTKIKAGLSNAEKLENLYPDTKTFKNAVKNFVKEMGQVYVWDQIDHVTVTDYTGSIDITEEYPQGNIIYESLSNQRINIIQSNPYVLAYMIYGPDGSSRTGDGAWGTVGLCDSSGKEFNCLQVPITKYQNQVVFLQFQLEQV